ncbi:chemotaxis protein CheB [Nibrella viscosa]|uniref:protein-glutamate methylesterase n=1 Tax=Nibrella viscosa TaxID=1084524 RepID=A0ABP8KYS9_9BACT
MINETGYDIVVLGGSAGSISVMIQILSSLPTQFPLSLVIVLHRLKNVSSEMNKILSMGRRGLSIHEPDDKEPIQPGHIYLAPQNYHLLVEADKSFSLDYSELVNYSRPAIDVTFESVAQVFGARAIGVLLSGANHDGAAGLLTLVKQGGRGIVQDPETADYPTMPRAALALTDKLDVFTPKQIVAFLTSLCC